MRLSAVALALLAAGSMAPAGAQDVAAPRWGRVPLPREIKAAYPPKALAAGLEGDSAITCVANRVGALEQCVVEHETPPGAGFGAAALRLVRDFRLVPTVADGKLVPIGAVTIPIAWTLAAARSGGHQAWDPHPPVPAAGQVGIRYRRLPHGLDLDGTYPAGAYAARLPGWAIVACRANAKGQLRNCALVEENPPGNGFGDAALKFVPTYFLLEPQADDGASVEGVTARIKLIWSAGGLEYFYTRRGER